MLGVRLVGGGDRHHFDLFKLVLANETARITPSRARLGAETRRQRRHAQGQGAFIQYLFAGEIGERDLRRRDQPQSLKLARESVINLSGSQMKLSLVFGRDRKSQRLNSSH